ncbi:protein BLISTER [Syzygium oleosum]|uniref:protein BLISTER n=1 Tax=Syzygium oleosum TaxID=219896 RepID=UPI0011D1F1B8|nr:protein BLISTER [Syzygium oleosum]
MASAQVLPSSRKQEHLEAGKRRLEEFRKKKAADRAKKAASNQINASDGGPNEKKSLDAEVVRLADSDAVRSSNIPGGVDNQPFAAENNDDVKPFQFSQRSRESSVSDVHSLPEFSVGVNDAFSNYPAQTMGEYQEREGYGGLASNGPIGYNYGQENNHMKSDYGMYAATSGFTSDQSDALFTQASQEIGRSSGRSSFHGKEESLMKENSGSSNEFLFANPGSSVVANSSPQNSGSFVSPNNPSNANILPAAHTSSIYNEDSVQPATNTKWSPAGSGLRVFDTARFTGSKASDFQERKLGSIFNELPSTQSATSQISGHSSSDFNSDLNSSSNTFSLYSTVSESHPQRSRPSFLDSLNVTRSSPSLPSKSVEPEEPVMRNSLNFGSIDAGNSNPFRHTNDGNVGPFSKPRTSPGPDVPMHSISSSPFAFNLESRTGEQSIESKPEFYTSKQNEDFAALEQHIEDLTQEKFSLQRALEASRALAESLAADNSSLTDSYNQQRSVVNQLKADMEQLQEEINARLVELEAIKHEYTNAQLECNAADERAKLLASEVIGLEEKALRLRSSELKLERQLENLQAEISTYKKKVSSLEKDRQDLQSTVSALQEEKKLLQSKLRKAAAGRVSGDLSKSVASRKDISTSTDDLDVISESPIQHTEHDRSLSGFDTSSSLLSEDVQLNIEASSVYIPADQMRMIVNINTVISELALEKEELLKALASETSENTKLKALNEELSRKLEIQTQRLELLTAQSMVHDNLPSTKLPDFHNMQENTAYADEGDEVVERVLGWIMKLFPGGPSRRRTSKLL